MKKFTSFLIALFFLMPTLLNAQINGLDAKKNNKINEKDKAEWFAKLFSGSNSKATTTMTGTASEGNLRVSVLDNGNMSVARYTTSSWLEQWYGGSSRGIRLWIDGTSYSPSGNYFSSSATALPLTSNTLVAADHIQTIYTLSSVVQLTLDIYYTDGTSYALYNYSIKNLSASTWSNVRFFSGGDTYLAGGDNGSGFWDGLASSIGVKKISGSNQIKMIFKGITEPYNYQSDNYYNVYNSVNTSGALTGVIDPNEGTDNGYALEWRTTNVSASSTWSIQSREEFKFKPVTTSLIVDAPATTKIATSSSSQIVFTVTNRTSSSSGVSLSTSVNRAGWTATVVSPSSPFTLAANEVKNITVNVTCPAEANGIVGEVTLTATDTYGSASDIASMLVSDIPVINTHPSNTSACAGGNASFSMTGTNVTAYQWQEYSTSWANVTNGGIYSGATSATLNLTGVTAVMNNRSYRCVVSKGVNSAETNIATLTVNAATLITTQPTGATKNALTSVSFTVAASGSGTLSYQWKKDGNDISGASSATYSISSLNTSDAGSYTCVVTGSCGSVTSNAAVLVVNKLTQTITFGALTAKTYGNAPFTVSATGGASGNAVTFTSSDNSIAECSGTNGTTITILKAGSCSIYANQAGSLNYNAATQVTQNLTINTKNLTISGISAANKIYDGNTNAVLSGGSLVGVINADDVVLNLGTGVFDNKNAGNAKLVTASGYSISGTKASNYNLSQPTGLSANITAKAISVNANANQSKIYGENRPHFLV